MNKEIQTLIRFRLAMARETLNDALLLRSQGGTPWGIVNRAYYAMFYGTLALLLFIGKGSSKHSGVIALFDQYFIKTERLPRETSFWLHKAFDLRQMGDYRELVTISIDQADEILEYAKVFLVKVENLLKENVTDYE